MKADSTACRELGTDYIDIVLLHCMPTRLNERNAAP
jgi:aryl-alcohol dehydrogenase-like predicted oxidoreductase